MSKLFAGDHERIQYVHLLQLVDNRYRICEIIIGIFASFYVLSRIHASSRMNTDGTTVRFCFEKDRYTIIHYLLFAANKSTYTQFGNEDQDTYSSAVEATTATIVEVSMYDGMVRYSRLQIFSQIWFIGEKE